MCRNIKTLYNFEPPATDDEIRAAALQYVRKISGFAKPSAANEEAFNRAVDEVARASAALLDSLATTASPRDRAGIVRSKPPVSAPARFAGSARSGAQAGAGVHQFAMVRALYDEMFGAA